jgi:hypothetical protein
MRTRSLSLAGVACLVALSAACEAKKSENPLSPSIAGPIPGVEITAPKLLEPAVNFRFRESEQPIRLLIENASSNGVRPLSYIFEVATDSGFSNKVWAKSNIPPGEGGRTSVMLDRLEEGKPYFWRAHAEDGANVGAFATASFEVLPRAQLSLPTPLSPVNNERVTNRRPTLRVRNSSKNAAVGSVSYFFQISVDQAFTQIAATGLVGEGGGETSWTSDRDLSVNLPHYWRVRASDGETTTDWITTQVFRTPAPAPAPGPGPAPGPAPGGPCNSSNPESIVQCERAKYGFMSRDQMVSFLRSTAQSLNRNGIGGGPFGLLRKEGGNQCLGYSCDIICAGQGNGQRQYDVLGDIEGAQSPGWAGPHTVPHIRVDVCEIQ